MPSRRWLLRGLLGGMGAVTACRSTNLQVTRLTMGIVRYDAAGRSLEQYERFRDYLADQIQALVELEPVLNELNAVEKVQRLSWAIVFAPPGLAAIAISEFQYLPIFPMQGSGNARSVLIVREDSPIETLGDLAYQAIALGETGSAAGYYLPLYDLYGLTLSEIRFAPTPKTILEWVSQETVAAGALSEEEFQQYRREFNSVRFRVLHSSRPIPPGAVLLSPTVDRNQQQRIQTAMTSAPASILGDAGYLPNADVPNYDQVIQVVETVKPIEAQARQTPAVLTPAH